MKRSNRYIIAALTGLLVLGIVAIMALNFDNRAPDESTGTVLITGSNSGIGLRFARQYAAKGWNVIATHRRDSVPDSLQSLADQYENVRIERMNVRNHAEIDALAFTLQSTPIDILINNAGVSFTDDGPEAQTFGTLDYELFDLFISTNALGPVKVTESFFPNVAASEHKTIVNISSSSGSLSWPPSKSSGLWYRVSKTALNSLMTAIVARARESGVIVVMFEPGSVRFDVQKEIRPGQILPEESVASMIGTIEGLTLEDTGKFLSRHGKTQPW